MCLQSTSLLQSVHFSFTRLEAFTKDQGLFRTKGRSSSVLLLGLLALCSAASINARTPPISRAAINPMFLLVPCTSQCPALRRLLSLAVNDALRLLMWYYGCQCTAIAFQLRRHRQGPNDPHLPYHRISSSYPLMLSPFLFYLK